MIEAAKIELLILDVDGVMTDGRIVLDDQGKELKAFNVKDGLGLILMARSGVDVVILTGRQSRVVEARAKDLGITEVYQGVNDKGALCAELIRRKNLVKEQVCCMGDDLPDIPMFHHVGLPVAVADAALEVREAAHMTTEKGGGNGAVREVCELILKAKKQWPEVVSALTSAKKHHMPSL